MKKRWVNTYLVFAATFALTAIILPLSSRADDKAQLGELIAKHLESIGSPETCSSVHSRIAAGSVVATLTSPGTATFTGEAVMASDGDKNMIGTGFNGAGRLQEKFGFDGTNATFGFAAPGVRGFLGDFLYNNKNLLKEGLIGGTLSNAWPLLNLSEKKQKLEYKGTKKIEGKTVHEIKYLPRAGSDLEISLFFDATTFQHVRTEYTRVISAGLGTGLTAVDASGSQRPTRYRLAEDFSDFRKESGLTLPHTYKIAMELDTKNGTLAATWEFTLTDFAFNQPIPPATFVMSPKQ